MISKEPKSKSDDLESFSPARDGKSVLFSVPPNWTSSSSAVVKGNEGDIAPVRGGGLSKGTGGRSGKWRGVET